MIEKLKQSAENLGCRCLLNEPMCKHTSFKIGGKADLFIEADANSAVEVMRLAKKMGVPLMILGSGTNLLVSDKGIEGVVLKLNENEQPTLISPTEISCGAGIRLSRLCTFAMEKGLSGLEFAYGIPGSVGGAVYMNAGAYGGEIKDVLSECTAVNEIEEKTFENAQAEFRYRGSVFSGKDWLITKAVFKLTPEESEKIKERMTETLQKRRDKQPLEFANAGSTFKRPTGYYAAALIEECGLKGCNVGDAKVSEKHSGFLINEGNATANDVLELISHVKAEVKKQKDVDLETEVIFCGRK